MGDDSFNEIMAQYEHSLLPASHPTSRFVREVAEQIISSAGLGHMKSSGGVSAHISSAFNAAWNPDEGSHEPAGAAANDEWEVYVIKDDSTRNAFVLPG